VERGLSHNSLDELAAVASVLAPALSEGRRASAQLVSGDRAAFGTDLSTVYLPAEPARPPDMRTVRALTAGIAVQASPTKEVLARLDLSALSPRQRRAVRIVEGRAALAWIVGQWPNLDDDLARLAPGHTPNPRHTGSHLDDPAELLRRAVELAESDAVLDVPELFGVPPGDKPLSGHRERIVGDGRRRNRVPWSSRRNLRRMKLAMPVGGAEGEASRLVRYDEAPDVEGETSDADRRIGVPYPEWDYRLERYREDHVTVVERRVPPKTARAAGLDPRIRRWFAAPHTVGWRGRLVDGDQVDITAYVDGYARERAGGHPDDRVYQALLPRQRDVATALLLDATSSLQARGGARFQVQLACCEALCAAMSSTGERFAVYAFTGETRHRVEVICLRDFTDPPWSLPSGAHIRPSGYTRLGAALRHVTTRLRAAPAERRVLLSIGDGVPSDEGYEGRYAEADVLRAVEEAVAAGIPAHQFAVGQVPEERLMASFGADRYHRVTHADDLPGALARVHEELTRL
jgi:hypothetical protein